MSVFAARKSQKEGNAFLSVVNDAYRDHRQKWDPALTSPPWFMCGPKLPSRVLAIADELDTDPDAAEELIDALAATPIPDLYVPLPPDEAGGGLVIDRTGASRLHQVLCEYLQACLGIGLGTQPETVLARALEAFGVAVAVHQGRVYQLGVYHLCMECKDVLVDYRSGTLMCPLHEHAHQRVTREELDSFLELFHARMDAYYPPVAFDSAELDARCTATEDLHQLAVTLVGEYWAVQLALRDSPSLPSLPEPDKVPVEAAVPPARERSRSRSRERDHN